MINRERKSKRNNTGIGTYVTERKIVNSESKSLITSRERNILCQKENVGIIIAFDFLLKMRKNIFTRKQDKVIL